MALRCITEFNGSCDGCAAFGRTCQEPLAPPDPVLHDAAVDAIEAGTSLTQLVQAESLAGLNAASVASELLVVGTPATSLITSHKETRS
jgi:hypothetical protein